MSFENITPAQAHGLMDGEPKHTYLDVRSIPEFEAGHAPGAVNVPLLHMGPGGMEPNPDFLAVVEATLDKEAPLVVGCKMRGRSAKACELMTQAGFANLHNIDGGFGGRPDAPEESSRQGWAASGLPTTTDAAPEQTYEHLKSNA